MSTDNVYGLTPAQELELLRAEIQRLMASTLKSLDQTIAVLDVLAANGSSESASHQSAKLKVLKILADREFYAEDGLAVSQLKALTGHRTTNALSTILKRLEDDGLITRWTAGRRTYSISITPAGKQALDEQ